MLLTCIAAISFAIAQPGEIVFRQGLAIRNVGDRAPVALFADHVLAQFHTNGWKPPKAGDTVVGLDGKDQAWGPITSSPDGSFPRASYGRGWAFFEVESSKSRIMLLQATGCGMAYVDERPRAADHHAYGHVLSPVRLRKGKTSFLFSPGRELLRAKILPPPAPVFLNPRGATLPDIVAARPRRMFAGVIVVNASETFRSGMRIRAKVAGGASVETSIGSIPSLSHRQVGIQFEAPNVDEAASGVQLQIKLIDRGRTIGSASFPLRIRGPYQTRKVTFESEIDGSIQYYAINPAQTPGVGKPLVMALHGAKTEGIEMADDYKGKDWCHIVCATNRRPFGFDWEDTGRRDMLEVLALASKELNSDPERTYLTGHSMGGHGAWINGLMFPDKWAAVAPCAAWVSAFGYWPRQTPSGPVEEAMYRANNSSETILLKNNGLHYPIYLHHGDKDDDVDYAESVRMNQVFKDLAHPNLTFHTMPNGGHWFGTESIDWPGIFELFKGLRLTPSVLKNEVDFSTVNPAASSRAWWVEILQQETMQNLSRARFARRPGQLEGSTENISLIAFEPEALAPKSTELKIDGQTIVNLDTSRRVLLQKSLGQWRQLTALPPREKNPRQSGPFKEVFQNRFRFIYGTKGSRLETEDNLALARFHAEDFQVWGNGGIEIQSDRDYLKEHPSSKKLTNVVIFGNRDTHAAWDELLSSAPIQVWRGKVEVGQSKLEGRDLACLFIWPREGSDHTLIGVAASTGHPGNQVLERLQLFMPSGHFPDWAVVGGDLYSNGAKSVITAGYFDNRWRLPNPIALRER